MAQVVEKILGAHVDDVCTDKTAATTLRYDILPDGLTGFPIERIFYDSITAQDFVDGALYSTFYIETDAGGNAIKHIIQHDLGWQSLACSWDDVLYDDAGTWRVKVDADYQEDERAPTKDRIDESASIYFEAQKTRFVREIGWWRAQFYDIPQLLQADSALGIDVLLNPTGNKVTFDTGDMHNQLRDEAKQIYLANTTMTAFMATKPSNTFNWKRAMELYVVGWWANIFEGQRNDYLGYVENATVWATSTIYAIGDSVYDPITNKFYLDETGHTSSAVDFATDASAWTEIDPYNIVWEPYPKTQLTS